MGDIENQLVSRAPNFELPKSSDVFKSDVRDSYQKDLGRIIHSASFRRLQSKTQVMGAGEGDFHRTRLTHSLEVGQIGRGIVWNLSKRKEYESIRPYLPPTELIEAICYGHDLGHPPFGHAGEKALHNLMKTMGGFEGNAQTVRILTRLEQYYNKGSQREGIRPTRRLVLGILKYPVAFSEYGEKAFGSKPPKCFYDEDLDLIERTLSIFPKEEVQVFRSLSKEGKPLYKTFDCSIMELADDIAYGVHDLEDGIGRSLLQREIVEPKIRNAFKEAQIQELYTFNIDEIIKKLFSQVVSDRKHVISLLVGFFIENIVVKKNEKFQSHYLNLKADLPENIRQLLDNLSKEITFKDVVSLREIQTLEFKGEKIINDLFNAFVEKPKQLIGSTNLNSYEPEVVNLLDKAELKGINWRDLAVQERKKVARTISDFIASMTNPYAEKYHRRLFEPGYGSSTDEL